MTKLIQASKTFIMYLFSSLATDATQKDYFNNCIIEINAFKH